MPEDSISIQFPVKQGDVVIAASDGLWDNMFDDEIEEVLNNLNQKYGET